MPTIVPGDDDMPPASATVLSPERPREAPRPIHTQHVFDYENTSKGIFIRKGLLIEQNRSPTGGGEGDSSHSADHGQQRYGQMDGQ